jgi:adenine-specific DNA-methyltransferase
LRLLELEPIMKKLDAESPETKSADIVAGNINALKALFPEAFTEGKVDFEVLKGLLGAAVDERDEKFGLNWHGKRRARQIALTPSTGTLLPCPEESVDWDTTQNLMIEGDNLEVLKLLQKSYAGGVKLIYIDPPYNTGSEFVYPDDFRDNIANYLELTRQVEGGRKISSNTEASGRFHTDWLNMMYPRLKLARNLLRRDGALFVSIGEDEVANLRKICDDIFGEENFVASLVWDGGRKNDSKKVSVSHEYILVYSRDASDSSVDSDPTLWRERKDGIDSIYQAYEEGKRAHKDNWALVSKHLQDWYKSLPESHPARQHEHYRFADASGVYFASDLSGPQGCSTLSTEAQMQQF